MTGMLNRVRCAKTLAVAVAAGWMGLGMFTSAADRPLGWLRPGAGHLERDLNAQASRGLRFAAASDGLPGCAVVVMQAPEKANGAAEYRVVGDKDLSGALDRLIAQGFVPRASARGLGMRHDVIFERSGPVAPGTAWRLVEFEKLDDLASALAAPASEGFQPAMLVRPAYRSWPGLSETGLLLVTKAPGAAAFDVQVRTASRRNVDDLTRDVEAATSSGWRFELMFANTRDGGPKGRRERATVLLSKPRSATAPGSPVRIERRASFGVLGDVVLGATAYWDEVLTASIKADRRQAWASPVRLAARDVDCGPLGFSFQFDAPKDLSWSITGLVARPSSIAGDYELYLLTDQNMSFR
jgi:hypothetical protein